MGAATRVHDQVGGVAFVTRLVGQFYEGVAADPVFLRLYPE